MGDITKLTDLWGIKLTISYIITLFAPFKIAMAILLGMIIINTITGAFYEAKIRKLSSRVFRKNLIKIITYLTTIIVIRFCEVGIDTIFTTTILTRLIIGYLIITEVVSILENLTLLDVPLPSGIFNIILKAIDNNRFSEFLNMGIEKQNYINDIDEIINYQLPTVKSENMRELLKIKCNEWKNTISILDIQLSKDVSENDDLLNYKVSGLINFTNDSVSEKWVEAGIPKSCIESFSSIHNQRVSKWLESIRRICYSNESIEHKRKLIIEQVIIMLYQAVTDIKKEECNCNYKDMGH